MQRSAVSIAANIAEGAGISTENEFTHFLEYSIGSAYELETELLIAYNQQYLEESQYNDIQQMIIEIEKMLYALIQRITNK